MTDSATGERSDKRLDRGKATRRAIVEAASALFVARGYEATGVEDVLAGCAISRGALYHHFAGKEALFTAVLEAVEDRVLAAVGAASAGATSPLDALRLGARAWLRLAASDAAVQRIVLIEAPAVIGWQAWRALDERYGLGLLKAGLAAAAAAGDGDPAAVDLNAHLLLAMLTEAALLIARAPDPNALETRSIAAIETIIASLT